MKLIGGAEWYDEHVEPEIFGNGSDGYSSDEVAAELRKAFPAGDVEVWQTGGGTLNPVVALERNADGLVTRYAMLSDGWCDAEASIGIYEVDASGEQDEQIADWSNPEFCPAPPPSDIAALIRELDRPFNVARDARGGK